jgi:predicted RNA binding protein YcfA (HicA-like mRNA interferase family)
MKYSEFHRKIVKAGWQFHHAEGSHYFYTKDGVISQPIPFHGSKEMFEPIRRRIAKEML